MGHAAWIIAKAPVAAVYDRHPTISTGSHLLRISERRMSGLFKPAPFHQRELELLDATLGYAIIPSLLVCINRRLGRT